MPRPIIQNLLFNSRKFIGDLLSVRAVAAYGLRRLYSSYFGFCLQVRKTVATVAVFADIGFDSGSKGDLDIAALMTFASDADGGNVFVVISYDLTGNGYHQIQENPFQIVASGALITVNGRPALRSNNTASMAVTTPVTSRSQFTFATVAKYSTQTLWSPICGIKTNQTDSAGGNPSLQQNGTAVASNALCSHNAGLSSGIGNIVAVTAPNFLAQRSAFLSRAGGDSTGLGGTLRLKLSDVAAAATVTQAFSVAQLSSTFRIGGRQQTAPTTNFDGFFQEGWLFNSALPLTDEIALMANHGLYFGFTVI